MKNSNDTKNALVISSVSAFLAALCCFSPIVVVMLGLGSTAVATSLSDTLYGDYKWWFRAVGLTSLIGAYVYWYKRRTKECSIDEKKRERRKLLNLFIISLFTFLLFYVVWLYGILDIWGALLGIWE
jgi:uncharacterized membrane protein